MMAALQSPFPSFLAECCFRDGRRDAREGRIGASYCPHHGETAVVWYRAGVLSILGPSAPSLERSNP